MPREKRGSRLAGDQAFLKRGEGEPAGFITRGAATRPTFLRQTLSLVSDHTLRDRTECVEARALFMGTLLETTTLSLNEIVPLRPPERMHDVCELL